MDDPQDPLFVVISCEDGKNFVRGGGKKNKKKNG